MEDRLFGLSEVRAAGTVMLFYSFGSEVDTGRMAERVLEGGKRLLLPYLAPERMEAAEVLSRGELEPSGYGPREPARRVPIEPADVDVVVAPGLAFDRRGHRLGYGGGHYDRYLARLGGQALRVGIGFAEQLVDRLPSEDTDERLDLLVTEVDLVDCRSSSGEDPAGPHL